MIGSVDVIYFTFVKKLKGNVLAIVECPFVVMFQRTDPINMQHQQHRGFFVHEVIFFQSVEDLLYRVLVE